MLDLMQGESDPTRLVFPGAAPVRELAGFGAGAGAGAGASRGGRRRRRRSQERPPPADWDDVFQSQQPVVLRREHALARWPTLTPALLAESMREVRVHVSCTCRTVQMMSLTVTLTLTLTLNLTVTLTLARCGCTCP